MPTVKNLTIHQVKKAIKQAVGETNCKPEFHIRTITRNGQHCGCSGFIKNLTNGKLVYVNTETHTFTGNPYRVLYRTAEHLKDYTGGFNNYAEPQQLGKHVVKMLIQA